MVSFRVVNDVLFAYGPLGVFVVILCTAVVFLYRDNQQLRDKREEDAKTMTAALIAGASSQDRTAQALEEFTRRLPEWISRRTTHRDRDRGGYR